MIKLIAILVILLFAYFFMNRSEGYDNTDLTSESTSNKYISSSYDGGDRGKVDSPELDKIYVDSNNIINDKHISEETMAFDDVDNYAQYNDNTVKIDEQDPKNLYNADNYLPQEVNSDWFDTIKEPIPIDKRHLINTTRTIGLDTIGSSKKNCTQDIRGEFPNPKFAISPFLNSSIEPQVSNRGIFEI